MLKKILSNKKMLADIILVGVLLIISLSVFFAFYVNRVEGAAVEVEVHGKLVGVYPLSIDATYYLNNGTNVMVIESGYVYMKEANCPGFQDCVMEGKKRFVNQRIVCLPNEVYITVVGDTDEEGGVDF